MLDMLWPALIVVLSNVFYNISQKSIAGNINPFASLMITYVIAAILSGSLLLATSGISCAIGEFQKANWASFLLGASIVGLELGYVFLYRAG